MKFEVDSTGLVFTSEYAKLNFGCKAQSDTKDANTLHQTHSTNCHFVKDTLDPSTKGDAMWTDKKGVKLGIKTADCLPVLGFSEEHGLVFALHAGWRGLQDGIISKLLQQLPQSSTANLLIWIGPHIQFNSFEFELPAAKSLIVKALGNMDESLINCHRLGHCKLNLAEIARRQLIKAGVPVLNIHILFDDTYTDSRFHSYRRDGDKAGRQLSTIQLI